MFKLLAGQKQIMCGITIGAENLSMVSMTVSCLLTSMLPIQILKAISPTITELMILLYHGMKSKLLAII